MITDIIALKVESIQFYQRCIFSNTKKIGKICKRLFELNQKHIYYKKIKKMKKQQITTLHLFHLKCMPKCLKPFAHIGPLKINYIGSWTWVCMKMIVKFIVALQIKILLQ